VECRILGISLGMVSNGDGIQVSCMLGTM